VISDVALIGFFSSVNHVWVNVKLSGGMVGDGVMVGVDDGVAVGDGVCVAVGDGVAVWGSVGIVTGVTEGVTVSVGVLEGVAVWVSVGSGVGVSVASSPTIRSVVGELGTAVAVASGTLGVLLSMRLANPATTTNAATAETVLFVTNHRLICSHTEGESGTAVCSGGFSAPGNPCSGGGNRSMRSR